MKKIVLIGLLLFTSLLVAKGNYVLDGYLRDKAGNVVSGAVLKCDGQQTKTDENGYYKFTFNEKGKYSIAIFCQGEKLFREIVLKGETTRFNISFKFTKSAQEKLPKVASNGSTKFRGGRSNQTSYKIDGMKAANPVDAGAPLAISIPPRSNSSNKIGLATGGAKDVGNFRQNIENGYTPQLTDITVEGLFYDYFFDTGDPGECKDLFCPAYTQAISQSPFDDNAKKYLSVGLNSGMNEADFERKKLNLVIVLDISGSMRSSFDRYHYDNNQRPTKRDEDEEINWDARKIDVAKKSIIALTKHLKDDDKLGIVLFNNSAHLAKPVNEIGITDLKAIEKHIMEITAGGGTNMEAGLRVGSDLFADIANKNRNEYENRIIFLTDAQPNLGRHGESDFMKITRENAANDIFTSFLGIGIDFNTKLVEAITKVKGANYYSIQNDRDFKRRLDDEFEFMVTPLVFDLQLQLESKGYEIAEVYGSPEADKSTNEIMKINTLFPSKREGGETKGGLVLLELQKLKNRSKDLNLQVYYEDRDGKRHTSEKSIKFKDRSKTYFDNNGIRKGILLVNYYKLMREWIGDVRNAPIENDEKKDDWQYNNPKPRRRSEWEQSSVKLQVNDEFRKKFQQFKSYFKAEMKEIKDKTLQQELEVIDLILDSDK